MRVRAILQLTLVHVGVSLTVVPITGTLNRIMIADMGLPAVLVGLLVALPYMLSPLQIFVGNWADRRPLWGMHRSPWILLGGLMASCSSYMTAHAAFAMEKNFALGLTAAFVVFLIWGIGVNVASVSYLSLTSELTERSPKTWRTAAVGVMWTAMILSTIVASIALSRVLQLDASPSGVITSFGAVWLVATLFVVVGAVGIEPSRAESYVARHTANNPLEALQVLTHNATAKRFFMYLLLVLIGVRAQDVLLEPYAADALGMSVSETTRLEALWGIGVFITLLGGMGLIRLFGKRLNIYVGGLVAIVAFGLVILSGAIGNIPFFLIAVFLLGLASGLMTVSNLSFMLDMTIPQNVGLYIGAWGVANFVAQSLGNVGGALLRDIAYWVSGNVVLGYTTVFGIEIIGVALSLLLFRAITVEQFQHDAQLELVDILAASTD